MKETNQNTVTLLEHLVKLDTSNPPGCEVLAAEFLAEQFSTTALDVEITSLGPGRSNVVAVWQGSGEKPGLLLCGHLDTVPKGETPWHYPPHNATIADGKLWGRGAADMKGGVAAIASTILKVARSGRRLAGDLVFLGTAGEEVDCCGAQAFVNQGGLTGIGHILIPEPSSLELYTGHRGGLWLELTSHGKAAHASVPHSGINGVDHMLLLLEKIVSKGPGEIYHPLMGASSLAITSIKGGSKVNVIPDRCTATIDWRTVRGQEHKQLFHQIEQIAADIRRYTPEANFDIAILNDKPPVETSSDADIVRIAVEVSEQGIGWRPPIGAAPYFTDASVLTAQSGLPTLIWGPGNVAQAHQTDEYVELEQVLTATKLYVGLAETLLA